MTGVFDQINAALSDKPPSQGGGVPSNKATYSSRKFDAGNNRDKLQALGLDAMPEGGQEELDRQWNEFSAKQNKASIMLKAARGK